MSLVYETPNGLATTNFVYKILILLCFFPSENWLVAMPSFFRIELNVYNRKIKQRLTTMVSHITHHHGIEYNRSKALASIFMGISKILNVLEFSLCHLTAAGPARSMSVWKISFGRRNTALFSEFSSFHAKRKPFVTLFFLHNYAMHSVCKHIIYSR